MKDALNIIYFATMCILHRSIFLCAFLIYYVAGVQSQTEDVAIPIEDSILAEDVTSIKDAISDEIPQTTPAFLTQRRTIVGGVDDEREDMRGTCYVKADPKVEGGLLEMSSPLECARTCNDNENPKICYYRFVAEVYYSLTRGCDFCKSNSSNSFCNNCECISVDGIERPVLAVNRMIPGPTIDVCEGDRIVIDVVNNMEGSDFTIHWHGIFQKDSQYYDGVPYITQCPIPEQTTFRYQFNADNAGTHFWHAHTALQKMDGIFGRLTVRQSRKRDVNSHVYDYDLSRHSIIISDWMHDTAQWRRPGGLTNTKFQDPDSLLINGKGRYMDPATGISTDTDLEVFRVKRGYRYRFRMVNSFCTVCSSIITVEGHNLTVIATDGISVKPTVVNSIISATGERYDFVINMNNQVGSYWIQLRALSPCQDNQIQQLAILQYEGASEIPATPPPVFTAPLPQGIVLNPLDNQCDRARSDAICVSNLNSAVPVDKDIFTKEPDASIYISFKFYRYNLQNLFGPNSFYKFMVAPGFRHVASLVNNISFSFPSSPLLSQLRDIPFDEFCNNKDTKKCREVCSCTNVIYLPYNGLIELIVVDESGTPGLYHPFHLHGYAFNIMATGVANNGTGNTADDIRRLDKAGLIRRRKNSPPFKDTIPVPNNGYAVIRFRADNPGFWLFHCHFVYHLITGMANVFQVGDEFNIPPVPQDFPKCGNYMPPIYER